jgi:hypothetical protein
MELKNEELQNVVGGGIGKWVVIGGLISFVVGVIDGFLRPFKCK